MSILASSARWCELPRVGRPRGWIRIGPSCAAALFADSDGITLVSHVRGELEVRFEAQTESELDELVAMVDRDTRPIVVAARGHVEDCRTTDALVGRVVLELLESVRARRA